jgi:hypothetical protein
VAASQAGRAEAKLKCAAQRNAWIWRDQEGSETGSLWRDASRAIAFTPDEIAVAASAEPLDVNRAALDRESATPGCAGGKLVESEGEGVHTAALEGDAGSCQPDAVTDRAIRYVRRQGARDDFGHGRDPRSGFDEDRLRHAERIHARADFGQPFRVVMPEGLAGYRLDNHEKFADAVLQLDRRVPERSPARSAPARAARCSALSATRSMTGSSISSRVA